MSDTPTPILAAAAAQPAAAPQESAKADAAPPAPAPAAEAPKPTAEATAPKPPPRLNPWAKRAAAKPAEPAAKPVETAPAAAPVEAKPVVDPRVADLEARVASLSSVIARQATAELSALPENVRAYVSQIAGEDPAKRLDTIAALRASGLVTTPAAVPPGATTITPTTPAAPPSPPNPDLALLTQYEALVAKGSAVVAAAFRTRHSAALARAEAARGSRN